MDVMIEGTRMGLPAIKIYIESRFFVTEHPLLGLSHKKMYAE